MTQSRCPMPASSLVNSGHGSSIRFLSVVLFSIIFFLNSASQASARTPLFSIRHHHRHASTTRREHSWGRFRGGSFASSPTNDTAIQQQPSDVSSNSTNLSSSSSALTAAVEIPEWKQQLPPPLCHKSSRTLQRISIPYQDQVAEIYILGTAHVSNDSSRDVKLLLQSLHPDVIFVELCDQRTSLMEDPPEVLQQMNNNNNSSSIPFWEKVKEVAAQNNNSKFQSMATVLLTQTQEEYADSLGVELGGEFRAAYQYWRSFLTTAATTGSNNNNNNSKRRPHLILGDRPLAITLARCWESLSWFGKLKVLFGLILSTFHKPKPEELRAWIQKILDDDETDLLKASLEDLRKHFPTLERVIIQERDAYMACKLYQLCRGMLVSAARSNTAALPFDDNNNNNNPNQSDDDDDDELTTFSDQNSQRRHQQHKPIVIAALVGAGHVPGICAWLTNKSHPQGPEAMLATLIETKKYKNHDMSQLVYDVTELQDLPEATIS